jgi:leukotriene-A4 hydrolase
MADLFADCCTLSNYLSIRTTSIDLNLTVTFPSTRSTPGIISGTAKHSLVAAKSIDHVVFDTSFLKINKIFSGTNPLKYTLAERKEPYGSALTVQLAKELKKEETTEVSIEYETTDACTAVQWLNPEQTFGGKYPFMYCTSTLPVVLTERFSQCEAIHARSMLPCQDTPSVKAPYKAAIRSPLRVLTSAQQISKTPHDDGTTTYYSNQPVPIPSYLITICAGGLSPQ